MKHIKSKLHAVAFGYILVGLFATQPACADQESVSFEQEILVSDNDLSSQSGQGARDVISNANVNNNTITVNAGGSVTNGSNILNGGAFSGVSGIATAIQNSGNNVIIQNSTIVNVTLQ